MTENGATTPALVDKGHRTADRECLAADPQAAWRNELDAIAKDDPILGRVTFEAKSLPRMVSALPASS